MSPTELERLALMRRIEERRTTQAQVAQQLGLGRGPECTALVYVDDATGRLMELRLVRSRTVRTWGP